MNRAVINIFLLVSCFFYTPRARSETWYTEGTWEYYYKMDKSSFAPFENSSFKQELIKEYGDGTILARNTAICKPKHASIQFPYTGSDSPGSSFLLPSYSGEKERNYLADFSAAIVKGAATMDDAVQAIAFWVRNNITYALGSPMDAIGVINAKHAFCVGYAEVTSQLLRAQGIATRILSCYIPPGHGWGFGNQGGDHAFLEYYYPSAGWYCIDPQCELDFADPYHIVGYSYGAKKVTDVSENNMMYFVDFNPEPKNWATFVGASRGSEKKSAFVFNITKPSGGSLYGFQLRLVQHDVSFSNFPFNNTTWYDGRGTSFEHQSTHSIVQSSSPGAKLYSIIVEPDVFGRVPFDDTIVVDSGNCLVFADFTYKGAGTYLVEADMSDPAEAKKIVYYDKTGKLLNSSCVTVNIGGRDYSLYTDWQGTVYIKTRAQEIECKTKDGSYRIVFSSAENANRRVFRVPEKTEDPSILDKAIEAKNINPSKPGALACVTIDETGIPSGSVFERIIIYRAGEKQIQFKPEANGTFICSNLYPGSTYTLLASRGSMHVKKRVVIDTNKITLMRLDPYREKMSVFEPEDNYDMNAKKPFYEYTDTGTVIEYATVANRMYISFPPGEYVFSTNNTGKNLYPLNVKENTYSYTYSPNEISFEKYVSLKSSVLGTDSFIAGRIDTVPAEIDANFYESYLASASTGDTDRELFKQVYAKPYEYASYYELKKNAGIEERRRLKEAFVLAHYGSTPVRGGTVSVIDTGTGKTETVEIEESGFFTARNITPGSVYCIAYTGDNMLCTKQVTVAERKVYPVSIDNAWIPRTVYAKKESEYATMNIKQFYLLFPAYARDSLSLQAYMLSINPYTAYECFFDEGIYYLSPEKRLASSIMIDTTNDTESTYYLYDDTSSPRFFEQKRKLYENVYKAPTQAAIFSITANNKAVNNKKCRLVDPAGFVQEIPIDANGLAVIEKCTRDKQYTLTYYDTGFGLDYTFTPTGPALYSMIIDMEKLERVTLTLNHYDGFLSRTYPRVKNNLLELSYEKCVPAKDNRFTYYGSPDTACFMIGKNRLLRFLGNDPRAYMIDFTTLTTDAFNQYKKLFATFAQGSTVVLFSCTHNAKLITDQAFRLTDSTGTRAYRILPEGIGYVIGSKGNAAAIELSGAGYFYRKSLGIEQSALNPFELDTIKEANLVITKTLPKKGSDRTLVYLYKDPVIEKNRVTGMKEKLALATDDKGMLYATLPDGEYAVEANGIVNKATIVSGKPATLKFPVQ